MTERKIYITEDCIETGSTVPIEGKVVVLNLSVLPPEYHDASHQLYYCEGGDSSCSNPIGRSVFFVSLSDGERMQWNPSDVMGVLKPELLPDTAKLQLSQIRPYGAIDLRECEPKFSGYSFLPDGRYAAGVWLSNAKEVIAYIEMQKPYQHKVMICDWDDFCVFEMVNGEILNPSQEAIEEFHKEKEFQNGIKLNL